MTSRDLGFASLLQRAWSACLPVAMFAGEACRDKRLYLTGCKIGVSGDMTRRLGSVEQIDGCSEMVKGFGELPGFGRLGAETGVPVQRYRRLVLARLGAHQLHVGLTLGRFRSQAGQVAHKAPLC